MQSKVVYFASMEENCPAVFLLVFSQPLSCGLSFFSCTFVQLFFRQHCAPLQAGKAFRKFLPLFDRVLVERCAAETVTKGGIMIPEKAQGKVLQATVVAVGSGARGKDGEIHPVSVKVGEKVLLPEYGGTKIVLEDKDYYLFRDGDIPLKF
uniref:10 kDa heat shock protein, mitochondrial n=2 Tax=Galloanserae TaxID=1549675 RepID=A0A803XZD3_MELGA